MASPVPSLRVLCPDCSVVRVPANEVTLRNCVDDGRWDYWFLCPSCGRLSAGISTLSCTRSVVVVNGGGNKADGVSIPAAAKCTTFFTGATGTCE